MKEAGAGAGAGTAMAEINKVCGVMSTMIHSKVKLTSRVCWEVFVAVIVLSLVVITRVDALQEKRNGTIELLPPKNCLVAIAMTSIPPRYPYISHSIASWLAQSLPDSICRICIYIPVEYKRFKRKPRETPEKIQDTYAKTLTRRLEKEPVLSSAVQSGRVKVIEVPEDLGPLTRFMGVLSEWQQNDGASPCFKASEELMPEYWIVGDDDVRYSENTVERYFHAIQQEKHAQGIDRSTCFCP